MIFNSSYRRKCIPMCRLLLFCPLRLLLPRLFRFCPLRFLLLRLFRFCPLRFLLLRLPLFYSIRFPRFCLPLFCLFRSFLLGFFSISFINSVLISGLIRFSVLLPFFYPFLRGYFLSLRRSRQSDCLTFFGLCFFPFCDFSSFKFVSNHSEPCGLLRTFSGKRIIPDSHNTFRQYKLPL